MARAFNITREKAKKALHDLKEWGGLDPDDSVIIYDNGDVTTTQGDFIGNVIDEAGVKDVG